MTYERELTERLRAAGAALPVRDLSYEHVMDRARPARRRYVAGVLLVGAVVMGFLVVTSLQISDVLDGTKRVDPVEGEDREGPVPVPTPVEPLPRDRVQRTLNEFVEGVRDGHDARTWDLLTPRAQEAIGGLDRWRDAQQDIRYLFTWIGRRAFDLYLTPVGSAASVVTIAEQEPHGTSWLLTPFLMREVSGDVRVDLHLGDPVSLEPEVPRFEAGRACEPAEDCASPEELRPTITPGESLSVLLQPAEQVDEVVFALDGDHLLAPVELSETAEGVRATSRLEDGAGLPRETIFVVAILRSDGGVDSYAYRVIVEQ